MCNSKDGEIPTCSSGISMILLVETEPLSTVPVRTVP